MEPGKHIDKLVKGYRVPSTKNRDEAWADLESKIGEQSRKTKPVNRTKWLVAAAAFLGSIMVLSVLIDSFIAVKHYTTTFNERQDIWLPDSSKVTLGANSGIKVNYSFLTGNRKIRLTGQALFDIKQGNRFSVSFPGGKVVVLGTRFTISAYDYFIPEINCLSGRVSVKSGKKKIILEPETGVVIGKSAKLKQNTIDRDEVLSEIRGEFSWENETLGHIFKIFEAQFGYKINAPESVATRNFTGKIKLHDLKNACEVLALAMDLKFKIDEQNKTVVFENSR